MPRASVNERREIEPTRITFWFSKFLLPKPLNSQWIMPFLADWFRRINCGYTNKSHADLKRWILLKNLDQFAMLSYNVLTNNCWHFSLALLQFLDPDNLYDGQKHLQSSIESAQMVRRSTHQLLGREGAQLAETVVTLYNFVNSDTAAASSQQCSIM